MGSFREFLLLAKEGLQLMGGFWDRASPLLMTGSGGKATLRWRHSSHFLNG